MMLKPNFSRLLSLIYGVTDFTDTLFGLLTFGVTMNKEQFAWIQV